MLIMTAAWTVGGRLAPKRTSKNYLRCHRGVKNSLKVLIYRT
jgi:hypothetical protein